MTKNKAKPQTRFCCFKRIVGFILSAQPNIFSKWKYSVHLQRRWCKAKKDSDEWFRNNNNRLCRQLHLSE